MKKRHLAQSLGLTFWVLAVLLGMKSDGQAPALRPFIAYIGVFSAQTDPVFQRFTRTLQQRHPALLEQVELRYVGVPIESLEGILSRIKETVADGPRLLVTPTGSATKYAKGLATHTPIVFASRDEPLESGLIVPGVRQPQPITGVSQADDLHIKRLELLQQAFPSVRDLGVLADLAWVRRYGQALQMAATAFDMQVRLIVVEDPQQIDEAMLKTEVAQLDAWYIPASFLDIRWGEQIAAHLRRLDKPAIHGYLRDMEFGALMVYAHDTGFVLEALSDLVKRVLDGEDAAQIPVEHPKRVLLAVRAGQVVDGQTLSAAVLRRADLVY
nr:ABC transporter substrate binding protein [uncultured Roseateles sp.]